MQVLDRVGAICILAAAACLSCGGGTSGGEEAVSASAWPEGRWTGPFDANSSATMVILGTEAWLLVESGGALAAVGNATSAQDGFAGMYWTSGVADPTPPLQFEIKNVDSPMMLGVSLSSPPPARDLVLQTDSRALRVGEFAGSGTGSRWWYGDLRGPYRFTISETGQVIFSGEDCGYSGQLTELSPPGAVARLQVEMSCYQWPVHTVLGNGSGIAMIDPSGSEITAFLWDGALRAVFRFRKE